MNEESNQMDSFMFNYLFILGEVPSFSELSMATLLIPQLFHFQKRICFVDYIAHILNKME